MSETRRAGSYATFFFVVLLLGTGVLSFVVLMPFLGAIAWAIVLAVGFRGPWGWLDRKLPGRRTLAAILCTILIAIVVLLPAAVLASILFGQASDVVGRFAGELKSRNITSFADVASIPRVARTLDWLSERSGVTPEELQRKAGEAATAISATLAKKSGELLLGFLDSIVTFATMIFLLFFLFRDGEEMADALTDLIPLGESERRKPIESLRTMLQAIFRGSLLCALIQGVSGGIGWWLAGLPSPALAGAVMGILSLLPIGGTAIIWIPGALVCWFDGRHGAAIFLAAWGAIVTSFFADNVLKPLLIRGGEEMGTLVVFLGVFGGLAAFGLLGLFIGPMALALFATLLEILRQMARASHPAEPVSY